MAEAADNRAFQSGLYWYHAGVLLSGFLLGLVAAYHAATLSVDFSGELQSAKELGIVSPTVLAGYPESKDVLTYVSLLVFPVVGALAIWLPWARGDRRRALHEIFGADNGESYKSSAWVACLLVVTGFYIFACVNVNYFTRPTSGWVFLGEEGLNLAWAQYILSGKVYARDFHCYYGPMLIYPLVWTMKLFGTTIVSGRVYTYILNLTAYGVVVFFLYRSLRSKVVFILSSVLYLAAFSPFLFVSPNCSYLRVALGFLPLILAYIYCGHRRRYLLAVIGVILAQSILLSQEVGLCVMVALVVFFALKGVGERYRTHLLGEGTLILAGCLISLAPLLTYFYMSGALTSVVAEMTTYPQLFALGYGSLPFPSFREFLAAPLTGGMLLHYWVILVYAVGAVFLAPLLFLRRTDRDVLLRLSLLVFGIALFRSALGRSDEYHVYYSSQPAFLLVFLFVDGAVTRFARQGSGTRNAGHLLLAGAGVTSIMLLFLGSNVVYDNVKSLQSSLANVRHKWTPMELGERFSDLERSGGVYFERHTSSVVMKLWKFLETNTAPNEYVYFFPNEAMYYFLFDRSNPTKYAMAYLAATRQQRREIVADLEKHRPKYVVYSRATWRIDDIGEDVWVPEVHAYVTNAYRVIKDLGGVLIARRIGK